MPSLPDLATTLQAFFGETVPNLARQTGFSSRHSKLTPSLFTLLVVFGFLEKPQATYNNLAELALDLKLTITRQGIADRFDQKAVLFMRQLFERSIELLQVRLGLPMGLLRAFPAVYLLDSTQCPLPKSLATKFPSSGGAKSPAGVKFQTVWNLTEGQITAVTQQSGTSSDAKYTDYLAGLLKGSLILFDLGYVVLAQLAQLKEAGYKYLGRFNTQCQVYLRHSQLPFDWLDYLTTTEATEVVLALEIGKTDRLPSRLVAVKLPTEVANLRKARALAEAHTKGRKPPTTSLAWLANDKEVGYPRFKGYGRYASLTFPQVPSGCKLEGDKLIVSKVGHVKVKLHRPSKGTPKTCIITRSSTGKWYACFSCDNVEPNILSENANQIGLDVGLKTFATLSDGTEIENPRFFRKEEKELAKAQRKLSKAEKGTPERRKKRKGVARVHERIGFKRSDFSHQQSRKIVNQSGLIAVEDLQVNRMVHNHCLAKSISDAA